MSAHNKVTNLFPTRFQIRSQPASRAHNHAGAGGATTPRRHCPRHARHRLSAWLAARPPPPRGARAIRFPTRFPIRFPCANSGAQAAQLRRAATAPPCSPPPFGVARCPPPAPRGARALRFPIRFPIRDLPPFSAGRDGAKRPYLILIIGGDN